MLNGPRFRVMLRSGCRAEVEEGCLWESGHAQGFSWPAAALALVSVFLGASRVTADPAAGGPAAGAGPAGVSAPAPRMGDRSDSPLDADAGYTHDFLSGRNADWNGFYAGVNDALQGDRDVYGRYDYASRFGKSDHTLTVGTDQPISGRWYGLSEVGLSPTHGVSPTYSVLEQVGRAIGGGFQVQAAVGHSGYSSADTNLQYGTLEYAWGAYRAAYTLFANEASGESGAVFSHSAQVTRSYARRSAVGFRITAGGQNESIGLRTIPRANVLDLSLVGHHWFQPAWAFTYEMGYHGFGSVYNRRRIGVGVRHQM